MNKALIRPLVSAKLSPKPLETLSEKSSAKAGFSAAIGSEGFDPTAGADFPAFGNRNSKNSSKGCQQNCQQTAVEEYEQAVKDLAGLLSQIIVKLLKIRALEGQILPPQPSYARASDGRPIMIDGLGGPSVRVESLGAWMVFVSGEL